MKYIFAILIILLVIYMLFINYWDCKEGKCVRKFWGGKYFNKNKCEKNCVKSKKVRFRDVIDRSNPEFVLVF